MKHVTASILGQYAVCISIMYNSDDIINLRYCSSYDQSPLSQKQMENKSACLICQLALSNNLISSLIQF